MRISTTLERMGDLAQHVAKTARMRYPDNAVPAGSRPCFREMAAVADRMGAKMGEVLASKDVDLAREIEADDDRMDDAAPPGARPSCSRRSRCRSTTRSTSPCSTGTTSGTPTTWSASPAASSTW